MTQVTTLPAALEVSRQTAERFVPVSEATARQFADAVLAYENALPADDYFGPGKFFAVIDSESRVSDSDDRVVEVTVHHVAPDGYVTDYAFGLSFAHLEDGTLVAFNSHACEGGKYPTYLVAQA